MLVIVGRRHPPDGFKYFSLKEVQMSEPLFSNNKIFGEAFLPPDLVGRSVEMAELRRCLGPLARHRPPKNVWLHGPPGTGKTCAAKLLLNEFEQRLGVRGAYVNCWESDTFHAVLGQIALDLQILGAERLNTVFKMECVERGLRGKPLLIVLDEFDKPRARERDGIIYGLCGMPGVTLVCVSNSRQYYQNLDARVRSRLNAVLVEFRPYSQEQIGQILDQRTEMVPGLEELPDTVKERIATIAQGDARLALRTLQHAIVAAEAANTKQLRLKHVRTGQRKARGVKNRYLLAKLGEHHTLIFDIIQDRQEVESGDLWREYRRRCRRVRVQPAAPRTFSLYLRRLIDWRLITYKRKLGVRGNVRIFAIRNGSGQQR